MIADLNTKADFNSKPFNVQRNGVAIYTLSDKGVNDYVSNNHFTHHYLNKYPKEILNMLDNYAEEKDELNSNLNPYPVKEAKPQEPSNAKPITRKIQNEESSKKTANVDNNINSQFILKKETQAKNKQIMDNTNDNQPKQPSNTFKNYSQQIINCATKPGNEKYLTEVYKKEMEKYGKQTTNRFNTKIVSSK